jgi:ribonuclease BN (tRNA processing enzyme)
MRLQFVGSGDAFGSGGRFNTCFHVVGKTTNFMIDFGATSLIAARRLKLDLNVVNSVLFSHFHGDHFGGIPFLVLSAQFADRRERPLTFAGPPGIAKRYANVMDAAFPSFPHQPGRFPLTVSEIPLRQRTEIGPLAVTSFPVVHAEAAGPCTGLRIEVEGKVLAYSGDTEWTESLVEIGAGADLFVCECYSFERKVQSHTDYMTLRQHMPRIAPKRVILTHMSDDMLAHAAEAEWETAADGMTVEF